MRIPDAKKALKIALAAQERLREAYRIARPDNGDVAMLLSFKAAGEGIEHAIMRLCDIVPNGRILNPCGRCGRARHTGGCLPPAPAFIEAGMAACLAAVDKKTLATGERES